MPHTYPLPSAFRLYSRYLALIKDICNHLLKPPGTQQCSQSNDDYNQQTTGGGGGGGGEDTNITANKKVLNALLNK